MLSNNLSLNFCYLKIIQILHPHNHPKIIRYILKNKQKNRCLCIHKVIIKMKIKMKNRSYRYDINRPRSRHEHKHTEYKKVSQHLSNIWSSIHGGKWTVSIKYQNLRSFQEGLILLCRVSLKREE